MPARTLKQGGHRACVPAHMHASARRGGGRETLQVTAAPTSKSVKFVTSAKAEKQWCKVLQQI